MVVEVGGEKVVISGNAGGNQPGGGILAEFHVEANGVDNHVADVDSYGPIASGPLSGAAFPNSRVTKGTDYVWVKLGSTVLLGPVAIDQGNMQYHNNCRGPGN